MRIALVNDTTLALHALRRVLALEPRHEIAWEARDGAEAVQMARRDQPDLILMDLLMPGVGGVEATRRIMAASPCPILLVTSSVESRNGLIYEALGHGALDAVQTPSLLQPAAIAGQPLLRRIRQIERLNTPEKQPRTLPPLIAIGSSTGGPAALVSCLAPLPLDLAAAVLVAQHIDAQFAPGLVQWLNSQIPLPVEAVQEGDPVRRGVVQLACSNNHLVLKADCRLGYVVGPRDEPYRPSVNQLFLSLLRPGVTPGQAVVLTGMGRDGASGLLELRRAGWHTMVQNEATCVVYGMPRAAFELGAAEQQLDPGMIALNLRRQQGRSRPGA